MSNGSTPQELLEAAWEATIAYRKQVISEATRLRDSDTEVFRSAYDYVRTSFPEHAAQFESLYMHRELYLFRITDGIPYRDVQELQSLFEAMRQIDSEMFDIARSAEGAANRVLPLAHYATVLDFARREKESILSKLSSQYLTYFSEYCNALYHMSQYNQKGSAIQVLVRLLNNLESESA